MSKIISMLSAHKTPFGECILYHCDDGVYLWPHDACPDIVAGDFWRPVEDTDDFPGFLFFQPWIDPSRVVAEGSHVARVYSPIQSREERVRWVNDWVRDTYALYGVFAFHCVGYSTDYKDKNNWDYTQYVPPQLAQAEIDACGWGPLAPEPPRGPDTWENIEMDGATVAIRRRGEAL